MIRTGDAEDAVPVWPVTCSDCGESRDGVESGVPCETCGSTESTTWVTMADEIRTTDTFTVSAAYAPERPWTESWQQVTAALSALQAVYGELPTRPDRDSMACALAFFQACHELPEAIQADTSLAADLRTRLSAKAARDHFLTLVADIDNTRKHSGRGKRKPKARIGSIAWGEAAVSKILITVSRPDGRSEEYEASSLAEKALDTWHSLLGSDGLTT